MYKAILTSNQDTYQHKIYYSITETKFKTAICKPHKNLQAWEASKWHWTFKELWSIKNSNYTPNIVWEILRKHQTYNPDTKSCSLCLNEKLEIERYKGHNLLHKQSEKIDKCRRRNEFVLALYDSKDWIRFSVTAFEQPCVRNYCF